MFPCNSLQIYILSSDYVLIQYAIIASILKEIRYMLKKISANFWSKLADINLCLG